MARATKKEGARARGAAVLRAVGHDGAEPEPAGAGAVAGPAPADIAADFKRAVAEQEQEDQVALRPTAARVPGGAVPVAAVAPPPKWTAAGIGRAGVHLTNALLAYGDFELLEREEEEGLAEDVAYYLSARWPGGSAWEPELRLGVRAVEVLMPRVLARVQAARSKALDDEAAALAASGARTAAAATTVTE